MVASQRNKALRDVIHMMPREWVNPHKADCPILACGKVFLSYLVNICNVSIIMN